jgi:putative cardiolipin synthase
VNRANTALQSNLAFLRCRWLILLLALLSACTTPQLRDNTTRPAATFANPPATTGVLASAADRITARYGPNQSGFRLLDGSHEALTWRLALIDSAESSIDILTYLWYPDISGALILERVILAAKRGVRVRLVIDDLLTIGQDQALANIQDLPNVELRLFNPWKSRNFGSRAGEMIAQMERLNTRMHDKLLIADGNAVILGGRNIGDHYFGLNENYNFHDLDVLALGPLARDANSMFDEFWNSEWLTTATNLPTDPDSEMAKAGWQRLQEQNSEAEELVSFAREPRDWSADFYALQPMLRPGLAHLEFDDLSASEVNQSMIATMFEFFEQAESELLITNAYIIPGEAGIEMLQGLSERGVDIQILTNSLASHDVPAVNSHYQPWRKRLIGAGAELHELRADAEIQQLVEVPPVSGKFVGLHTKAAVVDRRYVFVGSMNLDPRSAALNTEMGAIIDSPALAEDLRTLMLRDMSGENAWKVVLTDDDKLRWVNDEETVSSQPSRGFMQNVMNLIFKIAPREQF